MDAATRVSQHRTGEYGAGRATFRGDLDALFDEALQFKARLSGSEWAERFGRIPKSTGAESGPVTLYGYQRGLLDRMCDPRIPLVTVLKAARVGYTRCATLAIGYHLHQDPTLCAIAQPVESDAEDFGGTEIAPMLRETPVLSRMMRPIRKGEKQDNATFFQLANGALVRIVGAAADDAFRRYSARFQFADEIDAEGWTPSAKTQGDKLKLFWTRGEQFYNRKQIRGSTPLLEETSRIWRLWQASDQSRYFVPCPQCREMQFLDWGGKDATHGIKWDLGPDGSLKSVWYQGTCGCVIDEERKVWMDARGDWRPTTTPRTPGHVGLHLWTGMSLNANASWPTIVQEWIEAQEDPLTLVQPFVNLRRGMPFKLTFGQEVKASAFAQRQEAYGAEVPSWVQYLTLGGDVQSGINARIEASVWGWGPGLECALIGHFVLTGDPAEPSIWAALDLLLKREFRKADGTPLRVRAAAIDSGGHHTAETYAFCNERRRRHVWAIKGRSEVRGRRTKVWPRQPTSKLGSAWYMIGGNAARDFAYGSLAVTKPGPRHVHFPDPPAAGAREIDTEFFEQLTRETLVIRRGGFTEWEKPAKPREVGVCFVYAYVAVCGLQALSGRFVAMGRAPEREVEIDDPAPSADASLASAPATESSRTPAPPRPRPQRQPGFLSGRSGWLSPRR